MTGQTINSGASAQRDPTTDAPKVGAIVIAAAVGAAERVLGEIGGVDQDEAQMLVGGLEALLRRIFGHKR